MDERAVLPGGSSRSERGVMTADRDPMHVPVPDDVLHRLRPPDDVVAIARRLEDAGFETWCVGGAVRDALLGRASLDWDLATAATPPEMRRLFRRTVPVGVEFGTMGILDDSGHLYEVTTFRRDVRTDGRHAVVEFGASLDEDLARRDFTINAIAYSPARKLLHDPFDGRGDLARGLVRAVGDGEARMREDRLRALRAIRFASRFGFDIEPETWRAVIASGPHLGRLSPERVKQELEKTLEQVRFPSLAFARWREAGAFASVIPPLAAVPDATLRAVDLLPLPDGQRADQRRLLRLAAVFSDLAPDTAREALKALRFSKADSRAVGAILEAWEALRPPMITALGSGDAAALTDGAIRRWVARAGRLRTSAVLRLAAARWAADAASGQRAPDPRTVRLLYRRAIRIAFRDPVEVGDLAIDGDDLRAAGVPPGPQMAAVLRQLLDLVLDDPANNTVETLLARARAMRTGGGN